MKNQISSLSLLFLCFVSCKKEQIKIEKPALIEAIEAIEAIKNHPEIDSPKIKQLNYSGIELRVSNDTTIPKPISFKFEYFDNDRIKKISEGIDFELHTYESNKVIISTLLPGVQTYNLDIEGKVINSEGKNIREFYFKNGFLLKTWDAFFSSTYSKDGNLVAHNNVNFNSKYTYTNFENNIRQSVMTPLLLIWDFRDAYLGNFSTNLIKKAVFTKRSDSYDYDDFELNFSYEFDAKNRVTKVIIVREVLNTKRPEKACKFEYSITY